MAPLVFSLLAVSVFTYVIHLVPVDSQCTTKHCVDGDNDQSVLMAMVARLQGTVEHLQDTVDSFQQHQQKQFEHQQKQSEHQQKQLEEILANKRNCVYC